MNITVNLWARKDGEIKRFLECFYERNIDLSEEIKVWSCEYCKPLESIDIISALMDNIDSFHIKILIQINKGQYHVVTTNNHNEIIRDIFYLFYHEKALAYN